jgi:hypothetical protein
MSAPKRSRQQREEDLNKLAVLYVQRATQMEIASQLGISQSQVSQDIKKLLKKWDKEQVELIDQSKQEQLQGLKLIEREMWLEWKKSQLDKRPVVTKSKSGKFKKEDEKRSIFGDNKNEPQEGKATDWRILMTEEYTRGDMEYMKGIMWCYQERAKIEGLYAPKKVANTNPEGDKEAGLSAKEELFGIIAGVAAKLGVSSTTEKQIGGNIIDIEANKIERPDDVPELAKVLRQQKIDKIPEYMKPRLLKENNEPE